jgi:hypothetical protein
VLLKLQIPRAKQGGSRRKVEIVKRSIQVAKVWT